ncbi:MAG: hypothetical protein H7Y43_02640 [Akkermansiaceae bacterium]|nr:hypothetical protein [Verrucomicrobiales bacterium]
MNQRPSPHPSPGFNLGDIYHVLFRHKKKILAIWLVGAVAAAIVWKKQTPLYESQAKLFIRYVINDSQSPMDSGGPSIASPSSRGGESIVASEMEILTSFDLALDVADAIGPAVVVPGEAADRSRAAGRIASNFTAEAPKRSAVVYLSFKHTDPAVAQQVLTQIIASYHKRHAEVHRSAGSLNESLVSQTDQLRTQLNATEDSLRNIQAKAGIVSLEETKKIYAERIGRLKEELSRAEESLAERSVVLNELTNQVSLNVATNLSAEASVTNAPAKMPPEELAKYTRIKLHLDNLRKMEQDALKSFLPGSPNLVGIEAQIAENEVNKTKLEALYPELLETAIAESTSTDPKAQSRQQLATVKTETRVLEARIGILRERLVEIQKEIANMGSVEGTILDLQRKRQLQEQYYLSLSANLARAQIEESLGPGRISNINTIQSPTAAAKDMSKLKKLLGIILGGAVLGGLALAFAIEFYLDRSIRRPTEVEAKLGLPLFVTIPRLKLNGAKNKLLNGGKKLLAAGSTPENKNAGPVARTDTASADLTTKSQDALHPFFDTLRDRLILYFEAKNLTHSPKLVAVTSCSSGSGISTVAKGLAASLSETGEGNVLLVDMNNVKQGTAHYFHKGKLECGLDEVLDGHNRDQAMVQDKLYVVSETTGNDQLPRILHKRFSSLMPKLRASDYDYIIFDMPPVSQISPTARVARFMDMVFMVVESEKTDREVVKRATDILVESKANVGVVLNKNKRYVPRLLQQEL